MKRPSPLRLVSLLTLAIASVSCGSIFIRLASAPSMAVAAYRVLLATLLLAPALASHAIHELIGMSGWDWLRQFFAGTALACHFFFWIASLAHTSVASSVLLVNTTPFFIGVAGHWLLRQPCSRSFWGGLALAFAGCLAIFKGDWSQSQSAMKGNALAIAGAVAMAIYLLVGATLRKKLSLFAYVWPVYGTAAIVLLLASLATQTPLWGFSPSTYLYLFLLALIPQCIGHTAYNWSLRWLSPALVALVSLAEPVGASLLAYVVLDESLTLEKVLGAVIILLGIYVATKSGGRSA